MNKLTKIIFGPWAVARDAVPPRRTEGQMSVRRRERLIGVWAPDPATGRLICTWRRPAGESNAATIDADEPPPARKRAA